MDGPTNAFAFPGGGIVDEGCSKIIPKMNWPLFSAMSWGTLKNRDHLVGLSRAAVTLLFHWATFSIANIGDSTSDFAGFINVLSDRSAGRKRELAADEFGLELLHKTFGHIDDAERFLNEDNKMKQKKG